MGSKEYMEAQKEKASFEKPVENSGGNAKTTQALPKKIQKNERLAVQLRENLTRRKQSRNGSK